MKHYIVSCRISSLALPSGGVGDPSAPKVYSAKELKGIEQNIPYLISQGKVSEFKDEASAKLGLENLNAVDAEIIEETLVDENQEQDELINEEAILEEEAKAEIIEETPIVNEKSNKKKNKKK